jgi:hypothetical protein
MRPDPVARFVADEDLVGFLSDIAEVIEDVAKELPDHGEFVSRLPPSSDAAQAAAGAPQVNFTLRYERIIH